MVVATFPTCHDPTLRELLRLGLPQRYIALVRPGVGVGWGTRCAGRLHLMRVRCGGEGALAAACLVLRRCCRRLVLLHSCAAFSSCALMLLQPMLLQILYLPQVHNPEYLNSTGIASMVQQHGIRLLAISPHVGAYARQVLEEQGVQVRTGRARELRAGPALTGALETGRDVSMCCSACAQRPAFRASFARRWSWTGLRP